MPNETIVKAAKSGVPSPNLTDYDAIRQAFTWDAATAELAGLPGGSGINIAYEAADRHVDAGDGGRVALRWIRKDRSTREYTYRDLKDLSAQFANALKDLGAERGEKVFSLLGRVPELFVSALGTWKCGAVFCPLFSAFGPEPIKARMRIAGASVLVTTERLFRRKVAPVLPDLTSLRHVILVGGGEGGHDFDSLIGSASNEFTCVDTQADELSTLHFTSGTTGKPKGAMHVHGAVAAHRATARFALDLHPEETLVRHSSRGKGERLVHRADRDPYADAGGR